MNDDWALIVASFQTQYGIRLAKDLSGMSWCEFSYLINGLSGETPLGRIVRIRAENSPEELKNFTVEEKKIRNEYRRKMAKQKQPKDVDSAIERFKQAFIRLSDENAKV